MRSNRPDSCRCKDRHFARRLAFESLEDRRLLSGTAHTNYVLLGSLASSTGVVQPSISPSQMLGAYGINAGTYGSTAGTGAGQTIAIVDADNDPDAASDLATFDTTYGLPAPPSFQVVYQTGDTSPPANNAGWEIEESIDVQWAHVVAPQANIVLFEANSNGLGDLFTTVDEARNYPGVSVVSMSWSGSEFSGETSYDYHFTTPSGHNGVTFLAATGDSGGLAGYPAVSPNVVAVGGTSLYTNGNAYSSETAWSGSCGGPSTHENEPTYQEGVQTSGAGECPDVAADANPSTGVPVDVEGTWEQFGGTSLATPCWAALIAEADQLRVAAGATTLDGPSQTLPLLYRLFQANQNTATPDFHDITSGSNSKYSAGPGYDMVTGLGSPIANNLLLALAPYPNSSISMTDSGSWQQGGSGSFSITVSNAGPAAASGTVTVTDTLPAGLAPTAADIGTINGWLVATIGQTVIATRSDSLAAGSSYPALTLAVNVDLPLGATAAATNIATLIGGGNLAASVTASDTILVAVPDVYLGLTDSGTLRQGTSGGYWSILVGNSGTLATISPVTVSDTLPAGVSPLPADVGTINGWSVTVNGQTVTATRSDALAPGATYPLDIVVSVAAAAPASLTDSATVSGGGEINLANDAASDTAALTSQIVSWQSVENYGNDLGQIALTINPQDGTWSEPRSGGIQELLVTYDEPIAAASFTPAAVEIAGNGPNGSVDLSGITITASMQGSSVGVIQFSPALPDVARYLVELVGVTDLSGNVLPGDNQCIMTALAGDVDDTLNVATADGATIDQNYTSQINPANVTQVRADYNQDGQINVNDLVDMWNADHYHNAGGISDPLIVAPASASAARAGGSTASGGRAAPINPGTWWTASGAKSVSPLLPQVGPRPIQSLLGPRPKIG